MEYPEIIKYKFPLNSYLTIGKSEELENSYNHKYIEVEYIRKDIYDALLRSLLSILHDYGCEENENEQK